MNQKNYRYPPSQSGYNNSHYMPPNSYFPGNSADMVGGYRYGPPGVASGSASGAPGGAIDLWNRDRDYNDYRREYDRRPPPPANS